MNENVYLNQQCDINNIGNQCEYIWLNLFRQHIRNIIKFGMIINKCILYNDGTAFKNMYTQTEDNRRQIIQFQYLNINDCIIDNYITDSTNLDVTQSNADDIYYFIHEGCAEGRYYTIQPVGTNIGDYRIYECN